MSIVNTFYFLILILSSIGCNNTPDGNTRIQQVEKISKKNLETFFQYNIEPVTCNDFLVPVTELKSTYSEFALSLFDWRDSWHLTDSVYYADNASTGITLNENNFIYSKVDNNGKIIFEYDKNNKLIKKQYFDKSNIKGGYYDFLYDSDYMQMYEVLTNKYTLQKHDTLKFYKFDPAGRPITITEYGKSYKFSKMISYDDNGLIQTIIKKVHLNDPILDKTEAARYTYVFNEKGDWIDLTIEVQDSNNHKSLLRCKRLLKD
jgi:hypothetical protein